MLNQSAVDALYSATYVEDYIDSVENLPDDIIRLVTRMREFDLATRNYLHDVNVSMQRLATLSEESNEDCEEFQVLNLKVQGILIGCQDLGDQKLKVVQQIQDHIENKARQLDLDRKNLESVSRTEGPVSSEPKPPSDIPTERNIKRAQRRIRPPEAFVQSSVLLPASLSVTAVCPEFDNHPTGRVYSSHSSAIPSTSKSSFPSAFSNTKTDSGSTQFHSHEKPSLGLSGPGDKKTDTSFPSTSSASSKKFSEKKQHHETDKKKYKRRKSTKQVEKVPVNIPIDPDEPTYCLCDQVSYGEMIGCDNDLCPIEWFHFNCVSLTSKPKGKWYCPKCRGDKPNIMKPKSIFLKELEKYNREKEEKA